MAPVGSYCQLEVAVKPRVRAAHTAHHTHMPPVATVHHIMTALFDVYYHLMFALCLL